jgi:Na+-transporting methylmalonyl-CoA/oxaloacetate decarboxylase gamma subunit
MKKLLIATTLLMLAPGPARAGDIFTVPPPPGAEVTSRTQTRVELETDLTHDEALEFYKETVKEYPDIKFRDWSDSTYIEDNGALPWHSITIAKEKSGGKTMIVVAKDNWTWIIGTLVLRFFGVFGVLIVLLAAMSIAGAVVSRLFKDDEPADPAAPAQDEDEIIAAVIAAARKFENK